MKGKRLMSDLLAGQSKIYSLQMSLEAHFCVEELC